MLGVSFWSYGSESVRQREYSGATEEKFWAALGGKPATIKPAVPDEEMSTATEAELTKYALFHVSDASGTMTTTEITERPLTRAHLKDDDSLRIINDGD